ncbi:hypothetical protein OV208_34905 [Corallococcus sp. bb12-1]|uniref:hypothetical protein n=1 Tax=Corallococcus sp. bb12-1 TaxID=2996784 RepID=UPI0022717352|nr:hypothetical protein [Corallococcus sp. bb12-1]MCY1046547.1 hypothetical protein [Corallococcus sp. bb12-1]
MNKKWVIGGVLGVVGLVAVGLLGLVALGYWADRGMDGSGVDALMDSQALTQRFAELNTRHPFKPPPAGQVLTLDEARLAPYLAVREATLPAYAILAKESVEFVQKYSAALDRRDSRTLLKAAGASMRMLGKAQAVLATNLEAQRMSPLEFQAITAVVYPPPPAAPPAGEPAQAAVSLPSAPENLALLEQQLAALTPQLEDPKLPEAQRLQLEQRRAGLRKYITTLEQAAGKDVKEANAALLEKHRERVAKAANRTFDDLLVNPRPSGTSRRPAR